MRLLLDSHVFVWAMSGPEHLTDRARAAIIDPDNAVFVSFATAWELWIKHARKPIRSLAPVLDGGAVAFLEAARRSRFALLGIALDHAAAAAALPPVHRDPFDRMLIAQAVREELTIVTRDTEFRRYDGVSVLEA
jgi:PIN domain nuclease of toxin-antitoxin system